MVDNLGSNIKANVVVVTVKNSLGCIRNLVSFMAFFMYLMVLGEE